MTLNAVRRVIAGRLGTAALPPERPRQRQASATAPAVDGASPAHAPEPVVAIAPGDPLFEYLQGASGPVDVERLDLASASLAALRAAGVRMIVPLVAQGELIGALYLGQRRSDQDYSSDDRRLLATLAAQTAPAIRVAQLVREQAAEIRVRERLDQEMHVAARIQRQFLPRDLPRLPDWEVATHYAPARAVGGDFYDFIPLTDGRVGIVVGDVTDKGVPAALIMARTQSILRGEAPRRISPAKVLERANEILLAEMPARMFVTCLYLVLEPATGRVVFANAGHNLPYVGTADGVRELRATGVPLGLLPGMDYQEHEAVIEPGASVLLYSDGLVEAHDLSGDMFGFPRLRGLMASGHAGDELLAHLLAELRDFTGSGWEQEDDITLVTLRRSTGAVGATLHDDRVLLSLVLPGTPGSERVAMDAVGRAAAELGLGPARLDRLGTAVSEAAMNAIEYGSCSDPAIPIEISAAIEGLDLVVRVVDHGAGGSAAETEEPDIDRKLTGEQTTRGWGLFLIRQMVDGVEVANGPAGRTVALKVHLQGDGDAAHPVQR